MCGVPLAPAAGCYGAVSGVPALVSQVPVLWWCPPLLVVPLCTLTAGNGAARAHGANGARAKAGAQSFFLSSTCRCGTRQGPE
jgi:hypothetical protein